MKFVDTILKRFEESLLAFGIAAASIVLFVNVVLRYFFNSGWTWAEELTRYTIVWIVFIGSSVCARKGMHLAVDALAIRFSESGQRLLRMFVNVVCVLFCIYLIIYGYETVLLAYEMEQITAALEMPMYYVYLAIPVGGFLMAIRFTQDFFLAVKGEAGERVTEAG